MGGKFSLPAMVYYYHLSPNYGEQTARRRFVLDEELPAYLLALSTGSFCGRVGV